MDLTIKRECFAIRPEDMNAHVEKGRDGAWRWEIIDEDGETYLRSDQCFVDHGMAEKDLEASSHLIRYHLERC